MAKQLLREYYELCDGGVCQDLLTEAEKKYVAEGGMILSGCMQKANTPNGNGRVYPDKVLRREIQIYMKLVKERRALGELDHPDDSVINLKNASHLVTDIWWDGDSVMGKVKVLNTPSGKILQALVKDDCKLGISSRSLGSLDESKGHAIVQEDLQLICFDFVSEPSTPGAFMSPNARISEGKQPNIFTRADRINRLLNGIVGDFS